MASAAVSAVRGVGMVPRPHRRQPHPRRRPRPRRARSPASASSPPFDRVAVDDNTVLRLADPGTDAIVVAWSAISVGGEPVSTGLHFAAASFVALGRRRLRADAGPRLIAVPLRDFGAVGARQPPRRPVLERADRAASAGLDHCLFSGNIVETAGQTGDQPTLGLIAARTVTVTDNRLRGPSDLQTLHLQPDPQVKAAIVMGNTSSGPIAVINGAPIPNDMT